MRNSSILWVGLLLAILTSCDRHGIYESNVIIPNETWRVDSIATFRVEVSDTLSPHHIYINIRNTTNYPNSNLFLFVTTIAPHGATIRDTVECILADDRGRWLGKGGGRIRDNQIPFRRNVRMPVEGVYEFQVQHGMRAYNLREIVSVGIRLEKP